MMTKTLLLMALTLTLRPHRVRSGDCPQQHLAFTRTLGLDCIDPSYTLSQTGVATVLGCALACSAHPDCLAFAFARPLCRRFVFGRYSRYVRTAGCTATSEVFVRQLAGVTQPGSLCGPGFGHDFRGTKYALKYNTANWETAKTQCESMGGLAQLAELIDKPEVESVATIDGGSWGSTPVWLGGYQKPGSVEPYEGWLWHGSGLSVNMSTSMWNSGDPDNDNAQDRICLAPATKLYNDRENYRAYNYLCQCVSPFV